MNGTEMIEKAKCKKSGGKKKGIILGLILVLMAISGIVYATTTTTTHQYLKKAIEQPAGFYAECWRVNTINATITGENPVGIIRFDGFKDFQAFLDGKPRAGQVDIVIEHIDQLQTYPAFFQELLGRCLQTSTFYGAEFKEEIIEVVTPDPVP
jgi:hypothetical protein